MTYLALGDSISIDDYTGVIGGGAARQFSRLIHSGTFVDLTYDGCTSDGVLQRLNQAPLEADVVTLTVGGNDLLSGQWGLKGDRTEHKVLWETLAANLDAICVRIERYGCPAILNTIYDPTDGDDSRIPDIGLPADSRQVLQATNAMITETAARYDFLVCDLRELFQGHGNWSEDPWLIGVIEPNLLGATQIANRWLAMFKQYSQAHETAHS